MGPCHSLIRRGRPMSSLGLELPWWLSCNQYNEWTADCWDWVRTAKEGSQLLRWEKSKSQGVAMQRLRRTIQLSPAHQRYRSNEDSDHGLPVTQPFLSSRNYRSHSHCDLGKTPKPQGPMDIVKCFIPLCLGYKPPQAVQKQRARCLTEAPGEVAPPKGTHTVTRVIYTLPGSVVPKGILRFRLHLWSQRLA